MLISDKQINAVIKTLKDNKDQLNNAIGLLEECIVNGKSGKNVLYTWFLGEQSLIDRIIKELIAEEKKLSLNLQNYPRN